MLRLNVITEMKGVFKSISSSAKTRGVLRRASLFATVASRKKHYYSRGFTLTEIVIVLGLIGILTAGIWMAASKVSENNNVNRATQQIVQIVENIRDQYANTQNPTMWGPTVNPNAPDITSVLQGLQLFPAEMGSPPIHALSGSLQVVQSSCTAGTPPNNIKAPTICSTYFRIVLNGLSQSGCTKMVEAIPVTDTALGIVQIGVANTSGGCTGIACVSTCTGTPCFFTNPVAVSTAVGWCDGTEKDNVVFIDYKLHN